MTVAVTGATGQLGRLVIAGLKAKLPARDIVALARSPEKAADLGVDAPAFDYDQPETLAAALKGVETLLLISSTEIGRREPQHRAVIAAAKQAGVRRIVYTSLLHADVSPLSLAAEHKATEAAVRESGLAYTILRNGWYTENHLASLSAALAHNAFVGSAGEGRISAAARADYAEAAVVALTTPGHEGQVYELAGDEAFTLAELAAEISKRAGRQIPYVNLPESEFAAVLLKAGLPEGMAKALASWDVDASRGALFDDSRQLSKLIGRPTTPLAQSVAAAVKV
jgi:NAD(P)H dehydrogenase (quinone)